MHSMTLGQIRREMRSMALENEGQIYKHLLYDLIRALELLVKGKNYEGFDLIMNLSMEWGLVLSYEVKVHLAGHWSV